MIHIYKSIMITLLLALVPFVGISAAKKRAQQQSDRQYWCSLAYKMAQPVLENMAKGELQKNMQTEFSPNFDNRNRKVLYMECFGRLMAGVAPWLTLPDDATAEGKQRKQLREWALASYKNAVDPQNPELSLLGHRWSESGRCSLYCREFSPCLRYTLEASRRGDQEALSHRVCQAPPHRPSLYQLVALLFNHREFHGKGGWRFR